MDRRVFILNHQQARRNAVTAVMEAPEGYRVEIKPSSRTADQNAKLHALFSDAAKQAKWGGRTLTPTQWKSLFISGHAAATGIGADMVPGLENEFVNIRESSASMSISRMSSLLEYVIAWCDQNGVEVRQ